MLSWWQRWRAKREHERVSRSFEQADALRNRAGAYTAAQCVPLVEDLLSTDSDRSWLSFQGLNEAPAAVDPLLSALDDPRFLADPKGKSGHALARFSDPLPRVLSLLERFQPLPVRARPLLKRLVEGTDDPDVGSAAAALIAGMGDIDLSVYRRRLRGDDAEDAYYAANELATAARHGHAEPVVEALKDDLLFALDRGWGKADAFSLRQSICELLVKRGGASCVGALLAPERLTLAHPAFRRILDALAEARVTVGADVAALILREVRGATKFVRFDLEHALILATLTDVDSLRTEVRAAFFDASDGVRRAAAPAWAMINGLPRTVTEGFYKYQNGELALVVRRWSAARYFAEFVKNGGFGQPVGIADLCQLALAGMRVAGAERCVEIVESAIERLMNGAEWNHPEIRDLGRAFYKLDDELFVKLTQLAIDHREEFQEAEEIEPREGR